MTLKKFDRFENLEDVKKAHQDLVSNLSAEDLKLGNTETSEPDAEDLNKGSFQLREIANVPILYYRNLNGDLYKFTGTAV